MSLTPAAKKAKDTRRYGKNGGDSILPKALGRLFPQSTAGATLSEKDARGIMKKTFPHKFLWETILRQLVGQGYLRPESGRYLLTGKGSKAHPLHVAA